MMNANLWRKELSERVEEADTSTTTRVHSAGGEVTVGEPQQSQSGRYLSTPALRHWEAPRRTTVDARNQPADKRMINRRLKPHRRPCAHFGREANPVGVPRGEKSLLPRLLTTDIR